MDPEVLAYYASGLESGRLTSGSGRLELERTKDLLGRALPAPPARVLDVGGGPGEYASWLASLGYDVHLIDATPLHVRQALDRAERAPARFTATLGDARDLAEVDASADAVLMLGPLYHLIERGDRLIALREAARVVRPGGIVAAAAISRFAALLDGLDQGFLSNGELAAMVDRELEDGRHVNPTDDPTYFTTAYFHRPEELAAEMSEAGLKLDGVYGIEGPGWLLWQRWDDEADRQNILRVARTLEREPSVIGVSPHLLCVGRRL
jgi:SAM-dependent methyltransferase